MPIACTLATLVFAAWFTFGPGGMWDCLKLRNQRLEQSERIRDLEQRKLQLAQYLASLKSGDEMALERAARDKYFAASNEVVYDIKVDPPRQ